LKSRLNISKAARLACKSRQTIIRHMENGTLPFHNDERGKRCVDVTDLERVYGSLDVTNLHDNTTQNNISKTVTQDKSDVVITDLRRRLAEQREEIEELKEDKRWLKSQLEKIDFQRVLHLLEVGNKGKGSGKNKTAKKSKKNKKGKKR
jgi:hypothetical protein